MFKGSWVRDVRNDLRTCIFQKYYLLFIENSTTDVLDIMIPQHFNQKTSLIVCCRIVDVTKRMLDIIVIVCLCKVDVGGCWERCVGVNYSISLSLYPHIADLLYKLLFLFIVKYIYVRFFYMYTYK